MFNVGPMELLVLAVIGLVVMGPERLPQLARDAARMLKTLREMANGARTQLREELGPEFADQLSDLRNLNPRTAITRAVLGDTDTGDLNPAKYFRGILDDEPEAPTPPAAPAPAAPAPAQPTAEESAATPTPSAEPTRFDPDAT